MMKCACTLIINQLIYFFLIIKLVRFLNLSQRENYFIDNNCIIDVNNYDDIYIQINWFLFHLRQLNFRDQINSKKNKKFSLFFLRI